MMPTRWCFLGLLFAACATTPPKQSAHWVQAESPAAGLRILLPPGEWEIQPSEAGLTASAVDAFAVVELDRAGGNPSEAECEARFAVRHPTVPPGLRTQTLAGGGLCVIVGFTGAADALEAMAGSVEVSKEAIAAGEREPGMTTAEELAGLLKAGRFADAYPKLDELVGTNPNNMMLRLWAGQAAMAAGGEKLPEAIVHLRAALSLHREAVASEREGLDAELLSQAMESLGIAYSKLKELDKAAETLGELTVRFPEYGQGFYNFACVMALKGDKSAALTNLERALAYAPELGEYARGDSDFATLHGTEEFEKVIEKYRGEPASK